MDNNTLKLIKEYVDTKVSSNLSGLSAYQVAIKNGFQGTEVEWLASLKGTTPHIGENGNWFIGDVDTHVPASGGGACPGMINNITEEDINSYFEGAAKKEKSQIL